MDASIKIVIPEIWVNGVCYVPKESEPTDVDRWQAALMSLEPDAPGGAWGMSAVTAGAIVNMDYGRAASKRVVEINMGHEPFPGYFARVADVAEQYDIPRALLTAIFCRESNHGFSLDDRGYGDGGNGFGVGQVDGRYHQQHGTSDPYSLAHMEQCAAIFDDYRDQVADIHPDWADKYVLKGAAVAYNSGPGNVATVARMDVGTTGNDYGADVTARAQFYDQLLPPTG